jgi:hypothetical protein
VTLQEERKVRAFVFIIFCIVIFGIPSSVLAATYYVDATNGSDQSDGLSPNNAWQTIKKVKTTSFKPGDEICFKRGEVFSDSILFVYSSGSKEAPIVFRDYGDSQKPLPVITSTYNFCIWMRDMTYLTFQNLNVVGGGEAVIELKQSSKGKTHDIIIRDCIVKGIGDKGCGVWVDTAVGGLVEGCEIYNCAVGFSSHDPGFTVRNCKVHDNKVGISVGTYDTIIEDNEIFENGVGIRYGFGYGKMDVTFRRNLIRDNKSHGFETWYGVVNAGTMCYNIIVRNGGDGVFLKNSVSDIHIFNNVIYGNGGQGIHLGIEKDKTPQNIILKNNIIMDNKGYELKVAKGVSGLMSDYNCVYRTLPGPLMEWYGSAYTWKDWNRHSKQDSHSINQDPLFVNKADGDFRVMVNSPCDNAGVDTGINGKDYFGNPIFPERYDIGVHQLQTVESDKKPVAILPHPDI